MAYILRSMADDLVLYSINCFASYKCIPVCFFHAAHHEERKVTVYFTLFY